MTGTNMSALGARDKLADNTAYFARSGAASPSWGPSRGNSSP